MLVWITMNAFQLLFGLQIQGEPLDFLRFMGFIELLAEISLSTILACLFVYTKFIEREEL